MTTTRNRYLVRRGERWYYSRRIPKRYAHIDARTYSKAALNTDSLTVARERRDAMADADENLWDAALSELGNNPTPERPSLPYEAARLSWDSHTDHIA